MLPHVVDQGTAGRLWRQRLGRRNFHGFQIWLQRPEDEGSMGIVTQQPTWPLAEVTMELLCFTVSIVEHSHYSSVCCCWICWLAPRKRQGMLKGALSVGMLGSPTEVLTGSASVPCCAGVSRCDRCLPPPWQVAAYLWNEPLPVLS